MPDSKELAHWVAQQQDILGEQEKAKGKNYMLPKPPAPGEIIHCQICGFPMLPKDFSEDPNIRKHEFKWHIHWKCEQGVFEQLDRQTPGLMADRANGLNVGRGFKQQDVSNRH